MLLVNKAGKTKFDILIGTENEQKYIPIFKRETSNLPRFTRTFIPGDWTENNRMVDSRQTNDFIDKTRSREIEWMWMDSSVHILDCMLAICMGSVYLFF